VSETFTACENQSCGGTIIGRVRVRSPEAFSVLARLLPIAALLAALFVPAPLASAAEPFAPLVASATLAPDAQVVVSWVPGAQAADSFNVYGITPEGGMTLLRAGITDFSATMPGGFSSYAVTGVSMGAESAAVRAIQGECGFVISWDPPNVAYVCPETRKAGLAPDVRSPTWL